MKIILGDNPFFDINHRTGGADKGFRDDVMASVLQRFSELSYSTLMLSDHDQYREAIFNVFRGIASVNLRLALVTPVPHAINDTVARGGYKALVFHLGIKVLAYFILSTLIGKLKLQGTQKYFFKNGVKGYLRNKLDPYKRNSIKVEYFCLHNVFTDIFVATRNISMMNIFIAAVEDMGMKPVLLTQNIGTLLTLDNLNECIICGSINSEGYMMAPGKSFTEEALSKNDKFEIWAMQILAGGSENIEGSLQYVVNNNVDGLVYATSKPWRLNDIDKYMKTNLLS